MKKLFKKTDDNTFHLIVEQDVKDGNFEVLPDDNESRKMTVARGKLEVQIGRRIIHQVSYIKSRMRNLGIENVKNNDTMAIYNAFEDIEKQSQSLIKIHGGK